MKPQEGELVTEISKLQCMVAELKTGFTSALSELSQIQHGDTHLRDEMEEDRRSCQKKALHLEALVESLREELGVMQRQILQLYGASRARPQQDGRGCASRRKESDPGGSAGGGNQCEYCSPSSRGKVLLHCYLQGLKAGLCEGTDARHQEAMQLLHSEWEYVSTLNQLCDKYKTPPAKQTHVEPHQTYLRFVEQLLQRHLLFRNSLQERLSAEHWKSLVGDILVQLIGHNDTSFVDVYLGYTTSLATFLPLEFDRIHLDKTHKTESGQMEGEEVKLLSLLLAPISRIHSYQRHIQNLLQWTGKEHPDCSLLQGTERALTGLLSRCHLILEEDGEAAGQSSSCGAAPACASSASCARSQLSLNRESRSSAAAQSLLLHRGDQQPANLTSGSSGCHTMHLECWSCSPVRRKSVSRDKASRNQPACDCNPAGTDHHGDICSLLRTPDASGWADNSDSGQGTSSQPTGKETNELEEAATNRSLDDGETDTDDTSAFDYSSVTSCSPDGTLRMAMVGSNSAVEEEEEEEEEEEDSQVPVLLKPTCPQGQMRDAPRERTVCLRWQIPRLTPHPPPRNPVGPCAEGPTPCLVNSYGKRLISIKKGSPPLHPKSAFRPIWDDPSRQGDAAAPERDDRQGFIPAQAPGRQTLQNFTRDRGALRQRILQQRGNHAGATGSGGLWDDSEDSEGPCSTV